MPLYLDFMQRSRITNFRSFAVGLSFNTPVFFHVGDRDMISIKFLPTESYIFFGGGRLCCELANLRVSLSSNNTIHYGAVPD
jgi:hypothetical protein